ncbi:hypothetical protein ACLOJK_027450 [Asimina triloba]
MPQSHVACQQKVTAPPISLFDTLLLHSISLFNTLLLHCLSLTHTYFDLWYRKYIPLRISLSEIRLGKKLKLNAHSLLASAGINIGLALIVLSLFSLLKKQPSTALVYLPRCLSKQDPISFHPLISLPRCLPSVSWIRSALQVSDQDIIDRSGLDALVVIRLCKLGYDFLIFNSFLSIKFFLVCSVIGLVILLPVNYTCQYGPWGSRLSHSTNSFTISNIRRGSERWGAALAAQSQQQMNPLLWITELAPELRDALWNNLYIPYRYLVLHKIGVFMAAAVLTIFFAIPVTAVQGIAQLENIKKWFPPARAVQLM